MIIDDLDAFGSAFAPEEADTPLIVDPDTMLPLPVTSQSLQTVSWDCRQVLQGSRVVQYPKFPPCRGSNAPESTILLTVKELLSLLGAEGSYQASSISRGPLNESPYKLHLNPRCLLAVSSYRPSIRVADVQEGNARIISSRSLKPSTSRELSKKS